MLTPPEVALLTRVHERTIRRMVDRGELAGSRVGGRVVRIPALAAARLVGCTLDELYEALGA